MIDTTEQTRFLGLGALLAAVIAGMAIQLAFLPSGASGSDRKTVPLEPAARATAPAQAVRAAHPSSASPTRSASAPAARPQAGTALEQATATRALQADGSATVPKPAAATSDRSEVATAAAAGPRAGGTPPVAEREPEAPIAQSETITRAAEQPSGSSRPSAALISGPFVVGRAEPPAADPGPAPHAPDPSPSPSPAAPAPGPAPTTPTVPIQDDTTLEPEAAGVRLVVLGPAQATPGDLVTFLVNAEGADGIAHAPLRVSYNPDVLEFQEAHPGALLSSGGTDPMFMASPGSTPGLIYVAVSRMPPVTGGAGSGTLCSVTFKAKAAGESPILTTGSRLLDASARAVEIRRSDSHVAIR